MNIASLHLEKTMLLEVFLSKRTQFSQGNNVVDAAASNRDRFLSQDICVSSTQLKRPIWNNIAYLHLEKHKLQEVFFSKLTQFSQEKQMRQILLLLTQMVFF
jgi:hypothetical protein